MSVLCRYARRTLTTSVPKGGTVYKLIGRLPDVTMTSRLASNTFFPSSFSVEPSGAHLGSQFCDRPLQHSGMHFFWGTGFGALARPATLCTSPRRCRYDEDSHTLMIMRDSRSSPWVSMQFPDSSIARGHLLPVLLPAPAYEPPFTTGYSPIHARLRPSTRRAVLSDLIWSGHPAPRFGASP